MNANQVNAEQCRAECVHLTRPIWRIFWLAVILIVGVGAITKRIHDSAHESAHERIRNNAQILLRGGGPNDAGRYHASNFVH